jgi:MFS family permease
VGTHRAALRNGQLVRHLLSFLAGATAEWMVFLGVLVYAYERDGSAATGLASISLLMPYVVFGPLAGSLVTSRRPQVVRLTGFFTQALGAAGAAAGAAADLPTVYVVVPAAIAIAAVTALRPSGARVLPAIVRSSRELTVGNVWNGYCETSSALLGPAIGTVLLAVGGGGAVLAGSAGAACLALIVSLIPRPITPLAKSSNTKPRRTLHIAAEALGELRRRSGALSVLMIAGSQFVVVGALDIIVVVAAEDDLGLGDAGPGWLLTALGVGGVLSGPLATVLARRPRQAPALVAAMLVTAAAAAVLAGSLTVAVAFVAIPVLGLSRSLINVLSDLVLHRSAPPNMLGAVYSLLEVSSGIGLIIGSVMAQIAIAIAGTGAALATISAFFAIQALLVARQLRRADASADVPVVAMAVMHETPLLQPLHQTALEDVARAAEEVRVPQGTALITEGETGDSFHVVTDGEFTVSAAGVHLTTIRRGGSFGEVALLADVPRTATVAATVDSSVLSIEREPFLRAMTGDDDVHTATFQSLFEWYSDLDAAEIARPDRSTTG